MSALIFHWMIPKNINSDNVTPHMRKKLLSRWSLMAKSFDLNNGKKPNIYLVTNDSKAIIKDAEINFKAFTSLEEAIKYAEIDGEIVYIEQGGTDLKDFIHPENAVYVFGDDYGGLSTTNAISVPADLTLHAETVAGIVLSYRYNQWH